MKPSPPAPPSASSPPPPPYSVTSPAQNNLPRNPPTYATSLRAPRIRALINEHVIKHVQESASDYPYSHTFIFVPSNVTTLMNDEMLNSNSKQEPGTRYQFRQEKVIGFPAAEKITLIRLEGHDNELQYWKSASVTREVSATVDQALHAEGYNVVHNQREVPLPPRNGLPSPPPSARSVEWKAPDHLALAAGEARSKTDLREITLRIENDIGLYETRSGLALVVKTEIGGVDEGAEYY